MNDWAHLLSPDGEVSAFEGNYRDEYGKKVKATLRVQPTNKWYLVEHEFFYPEHNFYQRCPSMLIPASHAFGDPEAPGFILHRIAFWKHGEQLPHGKLQVEDFGAESMNIKRLTEAKAGNFDAFNRGQSYIPVSKRELATASR